MRSVGTIRICNVCDSNWRPRADDESVSTNRTGDHNSQIDLTKYRRRSTNQGRWLAGVRKRIGTQLTAAVILLLIVGVGLGGATLSTSLLADNTDDSLAPTDDQEWTEYETIAVFRNDDIQPWYKTNTRRAVDRVFIEEDVPVTLGVIPAVNGADSPITDNGRTCGYLRSLLTEHPGQFEIALHGYTHDQRTGFYNGSEFGGIDPATQQQWMTTGTEILRTCTGVTPRTFIPPLNTYDTGTVEAANTADYRTISGGDWFTTQYYNETGIFAAGGLVHASEGASFVDWERDELHSQAELQAEFNDSYESNTLHIQMLHYQSFDTEADREKLRQLIRHIKSTDTAFLTVDQLTTGLQSGNIRETEEGWEIREPLEPPANSPDRLEEPSGIDRLLSVRAVS
ncbi:polysaccharide deacetylase (plasmid) [Halorubrum lacusprofundi ATCC 49239]|uniref:Polysaccharide deacetylase n=1 Tax=Halorubrum lacusprofundi (strain ATCC 49239 / DSM 5036 / JCM 8891 / ACAM 34) TaxID=416348 RepID=B9LWG1_HALLT|nr:polysaccharide deacetylase [Halorubrum lacusprofundi ATCC 49239]